MPTILNAANKARRIKTDQGNIIEAQELMRKGLVKLAANPTLIVALASAYKEDDEKSVYSQTVCRS